MVLLNDFFHIISSSQDETTGVYRIALNPEHFIFQAHFPGNPITPGVCQLGIVEELMSKQAGTRLRLAHIGNIKYMNIISPADTTELEVRLSRIQQTDQGYSLQAVMANDGQTFTKMSIQLVHNAS